MSELKELLIDQMKDLLHAETQLTGALPKMAKAAHHPKLQEAFQKHLTQTEGHVERLREAFGMLGEKAEPKPCKAMMGLIEEGEETISEGTQKEPYAADLALIAAAQRVEHYEISAYGTARSLARQLGAVDCARLFSHTLGEEESADFLLTAIADPILQQICLKDSGADVDLETVGGGDGQKGSMSRKRVSSTPKTHKGTA
jgi:Mn-containing catalase